MRRVRADNLEVDSQEIFTETEAKYGNRWAFFHRADLHTELRNLVQAPIELASEVTKVDPHTATINLVDGRVIQKDLLVIADGAHVSQPLQCRPNSNPTVPKHPRHHRPRSSSGQNANVDVSLSHPDRKDHG